MDFQGYIERIERRRGRRDPRGPENLVVLDRVDSTNAIARAIVSEYQNESQTLHPMLVIAREQSSGRGRQGRSWSSPADKGVYVTRVVAVAEPSLLQTLPLLVAIGLCRAMDAYLPAPCRLKWPNDLLVEVGGERKKVGGILIEAAVRPGEPVLAIIGFGVNYLHEEGDLPGTATSLRLLGGAAEGLEDFTWDLIEGVEAELAHLGDHRYAVESYRPLSVHRTGEKIVVRTGEAEVEGTFAGFDDSGRLLLDRGGERISMAAGEVIE